MSVSQNSIPVHSEQGAAPVRCFVAAVVAGTCLWAYWLSFAEMAIKWSDRPEYSHGWMVPLFAIFLLWARRSMLNAEAPDRPGLGTWLFSAGIVLWLGPWQFEATAGIWTAVQYAGIFLTLLGFGAMFAAWAGTTPLRPSWWGLPLLVFAIGVRLYAAGMYLEWIDFITLIPFVAGLVLLTGGWKVFRWSGVAIAFLFFMIPLPFTLEVALRDPLRNAGTIASTYAMQTIGLPAFSEGNVVTVNNVAIDVVEACSGLRMMMVFFALSVGLSIVLDRPLWQRLLVALSAIPIALITNIARITLTGLLYVWGYNELADNFFHDFAGWLMPLMGVALLRLELWYFDQLFVVDEKKPLKFGIERSAPRAQTAP
jgi:exosortase